MAFQLGDIGHHYLLLLILLAAAGFFYLIGFTTSLAIFLVFGVLFELGFWFKLFSPKE